MANNYKELYKSIIQMQKSQSIVQYMRHGPPARDGILCVFYAWRTLPFSPLPPLPLLNLLARPFPPDVTPLMCPVTSHPT